VTRTGNQDLLAASRLLENVAFLLSPAIQHLNAELRIADSRSVTTPGAATPAPPTNGVPTPGAFTARGHRTITVTPDDDPTLDADDKIPVTSVEAAVFARARIADEIDDIRSRVRGITIMAHELASQCRDALGVRIEKPTRCDPNGREGALDWGDFGCQDAPAKGTLCGKCYMREYRWRTKRGLPSRAEPGVTDESVA
jgi:hypothetical protein